MEQWFLLPKPLTLNFPVLSLSSCLLLPTQTPALPLVLPLQVSRMVNQQVKAGTWKESKVLWISLAQKDPETADVDNVCNPTCYAIIHF